MATTTNTTTTTTTQAPATGREAAATRLVLGLSQYAVAREMGIFAATLARWEASSEPLADDWRTKWLAALKTCAATRWCAYQRLGLRTSDLPSMPIAALMRLYTAGV